jgi:hypothetical protein
LISSNMLSISFTAPFSLSRASILVSSPNAHSLRGTGADGLALHMVLEDATRPTSKGCFAVVALNLRPPLCALSRSLQNKIPSGYRTYSSGLPLFVSRRYFRARRCFAAQARRCLAKRSNGRHDCFGHPLRSVCSDVRVSKPIIHCISQICSWQGACLPSKYRSSSCACAIMGGGRMNARSAGGRAYICGHGRRKSRCSVQFCTIEFR